MQIVSLSTISNYLLSFADLAHVTEQSGMHLLISILHSFIGGLTVLFLGLRNDSILFCSMWAEGTKVYHIQIAYSSISLHMVHSLISINTTW